jgi:hypothetical protein
VSSRRRSQQLPPDPLSRIMDAVLPELRLGSHMNPYTFLVETYATERLKTLSVWAWSTTPTRPAADWFAGETRFFDVARSRAWVLTRRIAHSAHHRGQLTTYLRLLGRELYSTYGPTADTGGLFQQNAPVIYRHRTVEELLVAAPGGAVELPRLPGPGATPPTERPG